MENRKLGQSYDKAIVLDDDLDIQSTSNTSRNSSQPLDAIPPARKHGYNSDESISSITPSTRPRLRKKKRIQENKILDSQSTNRTDDRKQPPMQEQQKAYNNTDDRKQSPTQGKPTIQEDLKLPDNCRLLVLRDRKEPVIKTWPIYSLHMKWSSRDINCHLRLVRTCSFIESDGDIGEDTLHDCVRLLPSGEKLLLIDDSISYMTKDLPRLQESYPLYYELILNKIANFELQDYDDAKWPLFKYIGKKYVTQTCSRGISAINTGLSLRERHWTSKQWKELRRHISNCFIPSFYKHDQSKVMELLTSRQHAGEWFRAVEKTIELAEFFVRCTWKVASKVHKNKQDLSKAMDLIKQWADTRSIEWEDILESNQSQTQA
jgi:hypothetical protein